MWRYVNFGRYGKWVFLIASAGVVTAFLYFSNILVHDLSERERERMEIWADATKEILRQLGDEIIEVPEYVPKGETSDDTFTGDTSPVLTDKTEFEEVVDTLITTIEPEYDSTVEMVEMNYDVPLTDINFPLRILAGNTTIPVLLVDETGKIIDHRNFDMPDPYQPQDKYDELSDDNKKYLDEKLADLSESSNVIEIELDDGVVQHLYYEDSKLLQRLSYFPYVQLAVMLVFLLVVYFAITSSKEAEQNKVWVGLSKETAHQLGTPISSLMAWVELLPDMGADADTCAEMDKDVKRLSTIASRFSKIGSRPSMEPENIGVLVSHATEYMASRISSRIKLSSSVSPDAPMVNASIPLFEWVMENLIKNAVDAMEGSGSIDVRVFRERSKAVIEVADTGKGIPSKNRKRVFKPGYTTKKRGWGLGLTLAKRIVEQYHRGHIFVKESTPGKGTTFRIELPVA